MTEDGDKVELPLRGADELARAMDKVRDSSMDVSVNLRGALKQALVDGKRLETVFRALALSISEKALSAALAPLEKGLSGAIGGLLGGVGNALGGGLLGAGASTVTPFAKGGVVGTPTYFPMSGQSTGLMGEAGAEAILPLARDASGRLGVAAGAGGPAMPQIVFNVEARDADSFARSEAQISTMVARAVGRGRRGL